MSICVFSLASLGSFEKLT
jgi:hypothetical protein